MPSTSDFPPPSPPAGGPDAPDAAGTHAMPSGGPSAASGSIGLSSRGSRSLPRRTRRGSSSASGSSVASSDKVPHRASQRDIDDDLESYDGPEESDFDVDDDGDDMSLSSSSSSTASRPILDSSIAAGAPTPFNTMFDEYAFAADTAPDASFVSQNPADDGVISSQNRSIASRPSVTSYHTYRSTADDYIPPSTRPVPAPPQRRSVTEDNHLSPTHSSSVDSATQESKEGTKRFTKRFRRRPPTQIDRDTARLQQLGYDAVLGRDYTFWSSLGIALMNCGFIQGTVFAVPGSFKYGGPTLMLVAWPISGLLSMALVCTLSELASAYPVAGGMASWAWKCARSGVGGERYWGWIMGAIVLGGHIGNLILVAWQAVSVITGTMMLGFEYEVQRYQMVLFFLAIVVFVGTLGSTKFASSSRYWIYAGSFGVMVWLALCISLLATGVRHRDFSISQAISTHYTSSTGWPSKGYNYILGWQYCTIAVGADVCAHMSEETQNPSRNVPKAMTWAVLLTYVLAYISIIILFLSVAPGDAEFLATQAFPVGHILAKALSQKGAIAMCVIIVFVLCIQLQAQLQAASRFMFAMARDRALPFSDTIKRTDRNKQPYVATFLCVLLWAPFACLLIGSAGVIYSVATAGTASLSMLGYLIPCALYLTSKLDLQVEGRSAWSMRGWSRPIAAVSSVFCLVVVVVQILPSKRPVTVENVSWSPVVVACTALISFITWKLYGAQHYSGPIRALTKWETGMEIDLDSTLQASSARGRGAGSGTTSLKLAVTPCYPETAPTVQVASAHTVDSNMSMGEWQQASFTTTEGTHSQTQTLSAGLSSGASRRRRGTTTTMGRVDEEGEDIDHGVGHGDSVHVGAPDDFDLELGEMSVHDNRR